LSEPAQHFLWDSCVFIAYLADDRAAYGQAIDDIGQYLDEARQGTCRIYCSTITLAEVTRDRMVKSNDTFNAFLRSFRSAIVPIDPNPNIMITAGHLRGFTYTKNGGNRRLGTPDAIHLATALALQDSFRVPLDALHTFDRGMNGKAAPIIGLEDWCDGCKDDEVVRKVIALKREPPLHRVPRLPHD